MAADGEIVIESDIPCAKCGYNLRTLGREGRCPECGEEIWPSIEKFKTSNDRWPPLTVETVASLTSRTHGSLLGLTGLILNQISMALVSSRYGHLEQWVLIGAIITMVLMWLAAVELLPPKTGRLGGASILCASASIALPVVLFLLSDFDGLGRTVLKFFAMIALGMAIASVPLSLLLVAYWLRRAKRPMMAGLIFVVLICHAVTILGVWNELMRNHRRSETTFELVVMLPQPMICLQVEAIAPVRLFTRSVGDVAWLFPGAIAQWLTAALLLTLVFDFTKARRALRRAAAPQIDDPPVPPGQNC